MICLGKNSGDNFSFSNRKIRQKKPAKAELTLTKAALIARSTENKINKNETYTGRITWY